MAVAFAVAGAMQYWPNLMSTAHSLSGPVPWSERLANFWFDTTKTDWRETMVLGVRPDQIASRAGMWWFDIRQQFGIPGLMMAILGSVRLWTRARPWAVLVILAYTINTIFAFTYNVGDTHVFYLPSHLFMAFAAGALLGWPQPLGRSGGPPMGRVLTTAAASVVIVYAGWRAWDTWPVIDRHDDRRAEALVSRLALGINPQNSVLVTDLNWQIENALLYYSRWERRDIPWVRLPDVERHFPFFVRDNEAISRDLVLDASATREVVGAFGPLFPIEPDPIRVSPDLLQQVGALERGTPYVLCVLTPPREETLDPGMLREAVATLTGGRAVPASTGAYQLMAGLAGETPLITRSADTPFRQEFRMLGDRFTVRMESWLPFDTFRRAGFGHVLRGREHVLILERGVNLVWFNRNSQPSTPMYAASIYAPGGRYRISSVSPALARDLH
jgi:hypothetical protein